MPQGGLAQVLVQADAPKQVVQDARRAEQDPEQREELYTIAAEAMMEQAGVPKGKGTKKIGFYDGDYVEVKKAKGGLADAAEDVRQAGRGRDEMLVHVTSEEYDTLVDMWGEPGINPDTGIPEYGLKKWLKKGKKALKKVVKSKAFKLLAPIALNVFAPGVGAMIGAKLGVGSMMGNALVRGGLGAVSGGKKGAIKGAFAGAAGTKGVAGKLGKSLNLSGKTADVVGSALLRGAGSSLAGEGFGAGAISGGLEAYAGMRPEDIGQGLRENLGITGGIPMPGGLGSVAGAVAPSIDPSVTVGGVAQEGKMGMMDLAKKYALPAGLGLAALVGGGGGGGGGGGKRPELPAEFGGPGAALGAPVAPLNPMARQFQGLPSEQDYYTYGQVGAPQSGQHLFLDPAPFGQPGGPGGGDIPPGAVPTGDPMQPYAVPGAPGGPSGGAGGLGQIAQLSEEQLRGMMHGVAEYGFQRGGEVDYWEQNEDVLATEGVSARGRYVKGPGNGRSDDIEARLSDGEYVIDAESVALLGDGSGDAGAQRLDEMRTNLRKHKGKNLKKGEFSHKAKHPDQYMGKLRRAASTYEHGGVHNVRRGGKI